MANVSIKKPESEFVEKARWLISTQLLVSVLVAAFFLLKGPWQSLSAFYGGLASICIAVLLTWGVQRATVASAENPTKGMLILYVGAVQRFLLVVGLLALGLAIIKLDPVALCVGFAVAQLSYLISSRNKRSSDVKN
ncbi:MAG: ATP synthase subunit I [Gammaproteobacteria bacterium]|nr:ATP synthase subunit I [Gammaproteobacteria bacterium]